MTQNPFPVRLYAADVTALERDVLYDRAYAAVSEERRRKTDHFRFGSDRRLSLGAELLLRCGLNELGIGSAPPAIGYTKEGKPFLSAYPDIHVNISHSGTYAVCAVSPAPVGCDIELHKDDMLSVAERFFYADEYISILGQPTPDAQKKQFFRLWTLKESFMKATGLGMKLPLNQFRISIQGEDISVQESVDANHWYFKEYTVDDGYACSACSLTPCFEQEVRMRSIEDILYAEDTQYGPRDSSDGQEVTNTR